MRNNNPKNYLYIFFIIILFWINFYYSNFGEKEAAAYKTTKQTPKTFIAANTAIKTEPKSNDIVVDNSNDLNKIFKTYMYDLQKKIRNNWTPENHKKTLKTTINFIIDKNGNLIGSKIKESSKVNSFDNKALEAIIKSSPFDKLPKKYKQNTIQIEFTFEYKIHPQIK